MNSTGPIEGRTVRPALIGVVALLAAVSFWKMGPPPIPGQPLPGETPEPAPPTPSPSLEAGGYADGSGIGERTAPPALASAVSLAATDDRELALRVYGDEQILGDGTWPSHAARVLEDRLAVAPAPWTGVKVDLEVVASPGQTAPDVLAHLWANPGPELVLIAVGWADGRPGDARACPAELPERSWWHEELAATEVHADVDGADGFYARPAGSPAVSPIDHVRCMDAAGAWGAERDTAVLYVEQPIHDPRGDRTFFASTGMRPQPWLSLVYGLEQQPNSAALVGAEPPLLSPAGHELVGRFLGTGMVGAVLASR